MRATLIIAASFTTSLVLGGCGDNLKPAHHDAAVDDASPDASVTNAVGPCLDRPTHLVAAPSSQLPCELISPGFQP